MIIENPFSICFICNEQPLISSSGGIGYVIHELSRLLSKVGHHVVVIGVYKGKNEYQHITDDKVEIYALPFKNFPYFSNFINRVKLSRFISKLHKTFKFDLIEVPDYQGWLWPINIPIPKILKFHSSSLKADLDSLFNEGAVPRRRKLFLMRYENLSVRKATHYCAVSKSIADSARITFRHLNNPPKNIEILYNGVDCNTFKPEDRAKRDPFIVLSVGTISYPKGRDTLISSWIKVANLLPNAELWLVGRDSINPTTGKSVIQELEDLIPDGIKSSVKFFGELKRDKLPELYQICDVHVLNSQRESFGVSTVEAMACGKAVIYSDKTFGREIVKHDETGLLCEPDNPDDVAEKIITLYNNATKRNKLGDAARKYAIRSFSTDIMVKKTIKFYKSSILK